MLTFDPYSILIFLIYLSFVIDLLGFPVPSEASTYQLFFPKKENAKTLNSNLLTQAQQWPIPLKFIILLLPTVIGIFAFLLPLVVLILPFLQNNFGIFAPSNNTVLAIIGIGIAIFGRFLSIRSAIQIRKQKEGGTKKSLSSRYNVGRRPGLFCKYAF